VTSRSRRLLATLDGWLSAMNLAGVVDLSLAGLGVIGAIDWLTGWELSFSIFDLAPVAVAA
jgi:hypothetical protein